MTWIARFRGGPRDGQRETRALATPTIAADGGTYHLAGQLRLSTITTAYYDWTPTP